MRLLNLYTRYFLFIDTLCGIVAGWRCQWHVVISVRLNGSRLVTGVLRGFDPFMNLVIDEAVEECKAGEKNHIGMVVCGLYVTFSHTLTLCVDAQQWNILNWMNSCSLYLSFTRRVRPPNGGRFHLHEPPSPVSTARPMWLTSGRISHEAVYAGRARRPAPTPASRAELRAGGGPCTLVVRDHGIYQRRRRRIG